MSVVNDKDNNEMIPGAVHRSSGICLTAEEKPRKISARTSHRLKWGPFNPNEVRRIAQHFRKGEGRKEGKDEAGLTPAKSPNMSYK